MRPTTAAAGRRWKKHWIAERMQILHNWPISRVLRLLLAAAFLMAAVKDGGAWAWLLGVVLGLQALLNVGCGSTACCFPLSNRKSDLGVEEITYEEVKEQ